MDTSRRPATRVGRRDGKYRMLKPDLRDEPTYLRRGDGPVTVGFYLTPDFPLLAFSAALDPLRQANRLGRTTLYRWVLLSEDGAGVANSAGFSMPIDHAIADAPRCDLIIVCTGVNPERFYKPRILAWLRRLYREGVQLGAVSTGAYVLARAGLLEGRRCVVHWENYTGFQEEFPNVLATNDIFAVDGPFITSSGGTVTLDMMLYVVRAFHGKTLAIAISDQFNHPQIRAQSEPQRMTPEARYGITNSKLSDMIAAMQNSLQAPISVATMARRVGLSSRQAERLFLSYFGKTPVAFYIELRMERAYELVSRTSLPIHVIAQHCGYASVTHFARKYHQHFGITPAVARSARNFRQAAPAESIPV